MKYFNQLGYFQYDDEGNDILTTHYVVEREDGQVALFRPDVSLCEIQHALKENHEGLHWMPREDIKGDIIHEYEITAPLTVKIKEATRNV